MLHEGVSTAVESVINTNDLTDGFCENQKRYRKVVETIPHAIYTFDGDIISYINPAGVKMFEGKDKDDILGRPIFDFIHPKYRDQVEERLSYLRVNGGTAPMMKQKMITLKGNIIDVEVTSSMYSFRHRDTVIAFGRDITQSSRIFKALKTSEKRYSKLIELSPDAIFIVDSERILFTNQAGVKLLGFDNKDELIGRDFIHLIAPKDYRMINNYIEFVRKKRKVSDRVEIQLIRKDGSVIDVEIANTSMLYNERKTFLNIVRDITERKEAELQLKMMMEENQKLLEETIEYDRLKTEFFSTISHELKTPLNIILSAMQLMEVSSINNEDGLDKDKLCKYIAMSKQNCYRLLRLMNNIIDISRIDTGFMKMNLQNYNIIGIIEDITLSVGEYAKNKGVNLVFDTEIEEKIIACDADKIERVILNLLSNAIKFTEAEGEILVYIQDKKDSIVISIKDTGMGIPQDKLDIIFERFRQVDGSLTRQREGSGIGLSLVKALIGSHGGKISVRSEVGKGSEFIIELPVKETEGVKEACQDYNVDAAAKVERINIEFSDIYL